MSFLKSEFSCCCSLFFNADATSASLRACALVESVHARRPASVSSIFTPRRSSGSRMRRIRPSCSSWSSRFVIAPQKSSSSAESSPGEEHSPSPRMSEPSTFHSPQVSPCSPSVSSSARLNLFLRLLIRSTIPSTSRSRPGMSSSRSRKRSMWSRGAVAGPVRKFSCVPGRLQTVALLRPRSALHLRVRGLPASLSCSVFAGHSRTNLRTEPLVRPEVRNRNGVGADILDSRGDNQELRIFGLVVPDRSDALGRAPDGASPLHLDHLIPELELELAREDEVDLLLGLVEVPVRALAARVLRHPAVGEGHLLVAELRGEVLHLARIVTQDV